MKPVALPIVLLLLALLIANLFFGVDIEALAEGFLDFLGDILDGPGK